MATKRSLMKKVTVILIVVLLSSIVVKAQTVKIPPEIQKLLQKNTCLACHKADAKVVGPAYIDVAKKKYTKEKIVELIYNPKPSNWPGYPPMSPMKNVPKEETLKIAGWIVSLAKK